MKQHFLQSPTWEAYEQLEGNQTFRLKGQDYEALAVLKSTPVGNYLFCPYGPAVKSKEGLTNALDALKVLAREQKAFFIRIEPVIPVTNQAADTSTTSVSPLHFTPDEFKQLGLKKSHDLDPAHTWMLDLGASEADLLNNMESRKVRYWRNASKKGITLRQSTNPDDITILARLLEQLGDKDNFIPQNEKHLRGQLESGFATLYIAEISEQATPSNAPNSTEKPTENSDSQEKKPIAAALIYDHDDTRFYAHAAADNDYRKLVPGTVILIQMILDAKNSGKKHYDFWGMTTSEDPKHPWYGFTQYKKSFGGYQVDYAGTWDLPLNTAKYHLYGLIRKANRLARKIKH